MCVPNMNLLQLDLLVDKAVVNFTIHCMLCVCPISSKIVISFHLNQYFNART